MENKEEGILLRPDFLKKNEPFKQGEGFAVGQNEKIKNKIVIHNSKGKKIRFLKHNHKF